MVIKALMRMFGAGGSEAEASASSTSNSAEASSSGRASSLRELEQFVDYVVKSLVDAPDEVSVCSEDAQDGKVIKISCRKEDVGKIVGKKGKTIIALRSLVGGAASRLQERISVEVMD